MDSFEESKLEQEKSLNKVIAEKVAAIAAVADQIPGIVVIHDIRGLVVRYMSPMGLRILGVDMEALTAMGPDYHVRFFNPEDSKEYAPQIFDFIERNIPGDIISFFQQVRPSIAHPWSWYVCNMKILLRDREGMPILLISFVSPADPKQCETAQVKRLLEEKAFIKNNMAKFNQLTGKEKETLRLLALGETGEAVAKTLRISASIVDTHNKNIRKKLQTNSFAVLCQYAELFGLI